MVIRTAKRAPLLGSVVLGLVLGGPVLADEVKSATADVVLRQPEAYQGRLVSLGGCQLGKLPDGPAFWVLVKGRSLGVIRLADLPQDQTTQVEKGCPRAGIGNGRDCLVRVFGWVEAGSQQGTTINQAAIEWKR